MSKQSCRRFDFSFVSARHNLRNILWKEDYSIFLWLIRDCYCVFKCNSRNTVITWHFGDKDGIARFISHVAVQGDRCSVSTRFPLSHRLWRYIILRARISSLIIELIVFSSNTFPRPWSRTSIKITKIFSLNSLDKLSFDSLINLKSQRYVPRP